MSGWDAMHGSAVTRAGRDGAEVRPFARASAILAAVVLLAVAGCDQMADQNKYEPYEPAPEWPDNQSAREPVAGTVARHEPIEPPPRQLPMPLTRELLERGRRQFETNCTPCHGQVGYGQGMVVQRGFPEPPSLHSEHLRQAPLRHFYDVITDGYGVMYSYAARVPPEDRWAVAAYIQALQLSQNGRPADLTPAQRRKLEGQR